MRDQVDSAAADWDDDAVDDWRPRRGGGGSKSPAIWVVMAIAGTVGVIVAYHFTWGPGSQPSAPVPQVAPAPVPEAPVAPVAPAPVAAPTDPSVAPAPAPVPAPAPQPPLVAPVAPQPPEPELPAGEISEEDQKKIAALLKKGRRSGTRKRIKLLNEVLEIDPNSDEVLSLLALAMMDSRKTREEALGVAKKAIELNPQNARAWLVIGYMQQVDGDKDESKISYKKCAEGKGPADIVGECKRLVR